VGMSSFRCTGRIMAGARCRHRFLYQTVVIRCRILHPRHATMASKKAAAVLRLALNGLGASSLRVRCAPAFQLHVRALHYQPSRPRKFIPARYTSVRYSSSDSATEGIAKTNLYDLHSRYGAKFVPFGATLCPCNTAT